MYIFFNSIFNEDKLAYVKAKLTATSIGFMGRDNSLSTAEIGEMASKIVGEIGQNNIPIFQYTSMKDHASAEQIAQIKLRMRCANNTLDKASPLLDGETIQDDFFSYLTEAYFDVPAGSAVLKRTTNMAVLYYVFEQLELADGNINVRKADFQYKDFQVLPSNSFLLDMIIDFSKMLIEKVAEKVGAKIIPDIFKEGVPDYFAEVYPEIAKIVHKEITQNTVDTINGQINGVQQWVNSVYLTRKAQPGITNKELFDMLSPQVDKIFDAVGILQQPSFSEPGLAVFMLAGCLHLSLLQEKAFVDPLAATPQQSSYAAAVKVQAQLYSNYAITTYSKIINERTGSNVIYVRETRQGHYSPGAGGFYINGHSWYDAYIDKFGSFFNDGDKHDYGTTSATREMQGHIADITGQLTSDLGNPPAIAQNWQELVLTPIPSNA